jgi:hypothetical protein
MARSVIPQVPIADLPEEYKPTAEMMTRLVGDAETIQVLIHSRAATDFYFQDFYKQMFYNGREGLKVDVRSKQLLRLRVSKRHGCALCNRSKKSNNTATARRRSTPSSTTPPIHRCSASTSWR